MVYTAHLLKHLPLVSPHFKCQHPGTRSVFGLKSKSRKMASTDDYQVNKSSGRLSSTKTFIYNSETGACLGRTAGSWGKCVFVISLWKLHIIILTAISQSSVSLRFMRAFAFDLGILIASTNIMMAIIKSVYTLK